MSKKITLVSLLLAGIYACSFPPAAPTITATPTLTSTVTLTATPRPPTETATPIITPSPTLPADVQSLVVKRDLTETTNTETGQKQLAAENGKIWFIKQDDGKWRQLLFELGGTENRFVYTRGDNKEEVVPLGMDYSYMFSTSLAEMTKIYGVISREPWLDENGNWRVKMLTAPMGWDEADGLPEIEFVLGDLPLKIGKLVAQNYGLSLRELPVSYLSPEDFSKLLMVGDQVGFFIVGHPKSPGADVEWGYPWGEYLWYELILDHADEINAIFDALIRGDMPPPRAYWGVSNIVIGE